MHRFSRGDVTFHTYISPDRGLCATAHVIEFTDEVLLIDATFFPETGAEVADLIKQIGKPVAKAVLSHEHPDHWSGTVAMPDVPFETLPAIRADVVKEAGVRIPTNDPRDHVRNSRHCVRMAFALKGQRHIRWRSRLSVGAACQGISGSNQIDSKPRCFNAE